MKFSTVWSDYPGWDAAEDWIDALPNGAILVDSEMEVAIKADGKWVDEHGRDASGRIDYVVGKGRTWPCVAILPSEAAP